MKFVRLASDVSGLPQAPDITFEVHSPDVMTADVDGFSVRVEAVDEDRTYVRISLDGEPYCACEYIHTLSPSFAEETFTEEVAGFVCGLVWSAWRRRELGKLDAPTDTGEGD